MKNLIPLFIAKKLAERKQNGEFHGFSIFFDISGFTAMTVKLMKEGKAGAEIISNILDDIFSPIVDLIHSNNGFVASFIGDAINAIFIDDKKENLDKGIFSKSVDTGNYLPISVIKSLSGIINIVKNKRIQKTKYGDFKLSIKIGVSYGKIKWGIAGTENHKAYYFMGEAIDKSIQNEKKCKKMQIVTDDTTLQYFSNIVQIHNIKDKNFIDKKFYIIDKLIDDKLKVQNKNSEPTDIFLTYNLLKIFFPDEIIKFNYKGEYREIVSIFISIKKEDNFEQIDKIIKIIISKCDDFQGYFNKVDFTDKGFTIIIFFGFPITYEDNLKRSLNFILSIKKILKQNIKAGITLGIAFSGILGNSTRCEYTCLGNIVNLSARMMTKAKYGKIWITKIIANKIKNDFIIEDKGYRKFKGIKEKINIFELKDEKRTVEISDSRFLIPMVGREIEFDKIIKYIQDIGNNKNSKLLYIYGDAGIGKSRLIYEAIKSHENIFNFFNLQTDSIIKGSLYPFADFLKKYFMQDTAKSEKQNKENFEKIYDK
ncbi:MAG: adenylate/guanylate cyclase domain-containing protein, partial [Exilispira sp.]